jgi:hypothetical protein
MAFLNNFQPFLVSLKHNKRNRKVLFEKDIIENKGAYRKFTDTKTCLRWSLKNFRLNSRKKEKRAGDVF